MKEDRKEVFKAWIDGETIQYQVSDGSWRDCELYKNCDSIYFDSWSTYRIKTKEIVTTTFIELNKWYNDKFIHSTFTNQEPNKDNLKLTWSPDGKTLLKAEVI